MKVPIANERELIRRIAKGLPSRAARQASAMVRLGIGDDAAVLRTRPGRELVLTCDFSLEARHFLLDVHPPDAIGWKSLARATSDIAAMGAEPRCFLLSMALPRKLTGKWLDDFLGGMTRAARTFGLIAAGGDTTVHEKVIVNITVVGEVRAGRAITRAGAKPGDLICVSGRLGEAQLGLEMARRLMHLPKQPTKQRSRQQSVWPANWKVPLSNHLDRPLQKHLYPEPRLALGQWLAENRLATAMIDTSDGLSTDLTQICEASGVGARLLADKIPLVVIPPLLGTDHAGIESPRMNPSRTQRTDGAVGKGVDKGTMDLRSLHALELALHSGEDYELLFTVPRKAAHRLPQKHRSLPLTIIGEITRAKTITIHNQHGPSRSLIPQGWDPFAKQNHLS